MRTSVTVAAVTAASLFIAQAAAAQPGPYPGPPGRPPMAQGPHAGPPGPPPGAERYYYNGRWVDRSEWDRRSHERERWTRNYERRHRDRDDNTSALVAGIIGFALGAAIIGSQQQAERARSADSSFDAYCAKKYRSYDRKSRTYLGGDGLRHYCE